MVRHHASLLISTVIFIMKFANSCLSPLCNITINNNIKFAKSYLKPPVKSYKRILR